jgi:hypothetical protein
MRGPKCALILVSPFLDYYMAAILVLNIIQDVGIMRRHLKDYGQFLMLAVVGTFPTRLKCCVRRLELGHLKGIGSLSPTLLRFKL